MTTASKATVEVTNFEDADERRVMQHGVLELVNLAGATIARATFRPGWRWSDDVAPVVGTASCQMAHTGVVLAGRFHIRMDDGREFDLEPGDAHVVAPGHDAWVVGDEECVLIDVAATSGAATGQAVRCPCGVEFRTAGSDQLEHLVAAVREHASGTHGHEVSREEILAEVSAG